MVTPEDTVACKHIKAAEGECDTGYSGSEYPAYKDFLNVGDIHSCEPWLYSECLAKNIAMRAKAWRETRTKMSH